MGNDGSDELGDDSADESASSPWDRRGSAFRDAVRAGYDDLAETYADQRDPDSHELELLEELSSRLPSTARVLDAGCGDGRSATQPLVDGGFDVIGLDISRRQLVLATEQASGGRFAQGDLTTLPIRTDTVDGVCAFHSIIHVPREEHGDVFTEFARVLRPGGHVLVTSGIGEWEGTNPDWLDGGAEMGWSFYGSETTESLLGDAGFTVEDRWTIGDELGDGTWQYTLAVLE